ncbi:peroxidase [Musa troglodytarum]|uniref:Peroxidase n=1 Tax=Musa troglodytarum TaxID=320322 RepID=A0A9E7JRA7_9LILI|nr:peroxidase [Musa troglodytarum]
MAPPCLMPWKKGPRSFFLIQDTFKVVRLGGWQTAFMSLSHQRSHVHFGACDFVVVRTGTYTAAQLIYINNLWLSTLFTHPKRI